MYKFSTFLLEPFAKDVCSVSFVSEYKCSIGMDYGPLYSYAPPSGPRLLFPINVQQLRPGMTSYTEPFWIILSVTCEPPHDKTNRMACALNDVSVQPGHPPSLISLRCPHEESLGP